jgi:hypothetical protein
MVGQKKFSPSSFGAVVGIRNKHPGSATLPFLNTNNQKNMEKKLGYY